MVKWFNYILDISLVFILELRVYLVISRKSWIFKPDIFLSMQVIRNEESSQYLRIVSSSLEKNLYFKPGNILFVMENWRCFTITSRPVITTKRKHNCSMFLFLKDVSFECEQIFFQHVHRSVFSRSESKREREIIQEISFADLPTFFHL